MGNFCSTFKISNFALWNLLKSVIYTKVSTSLPTSAEPKLIDFWMFIHVVILFLMFLVHVLVIYFHTKHKEHAEKEELAATFTNADINDWAQKRAHVSPMVSIVGFLLYHSLSNAKIISLFGYTKYSVVLKTQLSPFLEVITLI